MEVAKRLRNINKEEANHIKAKTKRYISFFEALKICEMARKLNI